MSMSEISGNTWQQVRKGDQLVAVNDVHVAGFDVSDIIRLILGPPGTFVK